MSIVSDMNIWYSMSYVYNCV